MIFAIWLLKVWLHSIIAIFYEKEQSCVQEMLTKASLKLHENLQQLVTIKDTSWGKIMIVDNSKEEHSSSEL